MYVFVVVVDVATATTFQLVNRADFVVLRCPFGNLCRAVDTK